ncbi:MAG: DnaD domain protein [Blautia sp.]|nr:DnaD domain protein [Blautia sp.]
MGTIQLQSNVRTNATVVSNIFIDNYMPEANGEFVKVYLYLLRLLSDPYTELSLESMADRLLCTEKDICRALKFWQKNDLLTLTFGNDKKLCSITLHDLILPSAKENSHTSEIPAEEPRKAEAEAPAAASVAPEKKSPRKLTADRVNELKQNEDIEQMLYIAEQYMGKTLTPSEIQKVLYFYDELHLSPELIEYLIEHCVSNGHKSIRYMETVACAWAAEGITTVKMAKESQSRYANEYFSVLKSMGITRRNPIEEEIRLINTWIHEYGFDMPIIMEACSRTVLSTGQPSFQYADKILAGWKKKNVKTMEDIRILDIEHQKKKQTRPKTPAAAVPGGNQFHNFQQRSYDFQEYEKRLLSQ